MHLPVLVITGRALVGLQSSNSSAVVRSDDDGLNLLTASRRPQGPRRNQQDSSRRSSGRAKLREAKPSVCAPPGSGRAAIHVSSVGCRRGRPTRRAAPARAARPVGAGRSGVPLERRNAKSSDGRWNVHLPGLPGNSVARWNGVLARLVDHKKRRSATLFQAAFWSPLSEKLS